VNRCSRIGNADQSPWPRRGHAAGAICVAINHSICLIGLDDPLLGKKTVILPKAFPAYIAGFLVFPQAYKARMSEVIIWRPFHKFKLLDQQGLSHNVECRTMPHRVLPVSSLVRQRPFVSA
jgi:hypothetical protein